MNDKLQEYLALITSEKGGEAVRDAIEKAIITIDADNARISNGSQDGVYREAIDTCLSALWDDVTHYVPNAVRPSYPDDIPPSEPMADTLKASLFDFIGSKTGFDIRACMHSALSIIADDSKQHNSVSRYAKRIIDLFNAAIDASSLSDADKRAIKSESDSWDISTFNNTNVEAHYSSASSDLSSLSSARTGAIARPLVHDLLSNIGEANDARRLYQNMSVKEMLFDNRNDFNSLLKRLFSNDYGTNDRCKICVGGVDHTREAVDARRAQYEAIDTEDYFGTFMTTYPVDFDNPEEYITEYYILIYNDLVGGGVMKFWSLATAEAFCYFRNLQYPQLKFRMFDSTNPQIHPYVIKFDTSTYSSGADAVTRSQYIKSTYGVRTFISQPLTTDPFQVLSEQVFDTELEAEQYLENSDFASEGSVIRADYVIDTELHNYMLCCGIFSGADAEARAIAKMDRMSSVYSVQTTKDSLNGSWFVFVIRDNGYISVFESSTAANDYIWNVKHMQGDVDVYYNAG